MLLELVTVAVDSLFLVRDEQIILSSSILRIEYNSKNLVSELYLAVD
jgi:hypothetical protein